MDITLLKPCISKAIYGQGAGFLKPALESYETLQIVHRKSNQGLKFRKAIF